MSTVVPAAPPPPRTLIAQLATRTRTPAPSLSGVARKAGVSPSYVSLCASLKRPPNDAVKRAAEEVFGLPWSQLFADLTGDDL